jgi:hypothetical protein
MLTRAQARARSSEEGGSGGSDVGDSEEGSSSEEEVEVPDGFGIVQSIVSVSTSTDATGEFLDSRPTATTLVYEVKFRGDRQTVQVIENNLPKQMVADFWTVQSENTLEAEVTHSQDGLDMCDKTKHLQHKKKRNHTAGNLFVVADNGIIIKFSELYVSEACSQVYLHMYTLLEMDECRYLQELPCAYDDACHPKAMAMNPKRRDLSDRARMMAKWAAKYLRIDRFHEGNHKDKGFCGTWCHPDRCNPACEDECSVVDGDKCRVFEGVKTEKCEETFQWLSRYRFMCRHMSKARYHFFISEMCEMHNEAMAAKLRS